MVVRMSPAPLFEVHCTSAPVLVDRWISSNRTHEVKTDLAGKEKQLCSSCAKHPKVQAVAKRLSELQDPNLHAVVAVGVTRATPTQRHVDANHKLDVRDNVHWSWLIVALWSAW